MVDVTAVYAFRGVDAMAFKRLEVAGVREPVQFIEIVDEILESERPAPKLDIHVSVRQLASVLG